MSADESRYAPTTAQNIEYLRLAHALQSGVKTEHELGSDDGSPKHLRVGIALCRAQLSALRMLLVDAGVISNDASWDVLLAEIKAEVTDYETRLTERFGKTVRLL